MEDYNQDKKKIIKLAVTQYTSPFTGVRFSTVPLI